MVAGLGTTTEVMGYTGLWGKAILPRLWGIRVCGARRYYRGYGVYGFVGLGATTEVMGYTGAA